MHLLLIASTFLQLIPTYLPECLRITSDRILMSKLASGGTLSRVLHAVLLHIFLNTTKTICHKMHLLCLWWQLFIKKKKSKAWVYKIGGKAPALVTKWSWKSHVTSLRCHFLPLWNELLMQNWCYIIQFFTLFYWSFFYSYLFSSVSLRHGLCTTSFSNTLYKLYFCLVTMVISATWMLG